MFARRFRLDRNGNLHADRLFCRDVRGDTGLLPEARAWALRPIKEARQAKSSAVVGFEKALHAGDENGMESQARQVHVLMLSQRIRWPPKRDQPWVSAHATTGSQPANPKNH